MTKPPDFYPPRLYPQLVRAIQAIAPPLGRWLYWMQLQIDDASLQRLMALKGKRFLLLPNHPTFHDPIVMFLLSARLRSPFHYLAAYETFENPSTIFLIAHELHSLSSLMQAEPVKQIFRWMLQRLGMYSIRRGYADRPSISQTMHLLARPTCQLVIFPEGGCSFQNDTVRPFQVGSIQMAFKTLQSLHKHEGQIPDLYVVPVSVKYFYTQEMTTVIHKTLSRLEDALGLTHQNLVADSVAAIRTSNMSALYKRLRAIAATVLVQLEREYGLHSDENQDQPWNPRIDALKTHVLSQCERELSLSPAPEDLRRERVYRAQQVLRSQADAEDDSKQWSKAAMEKALSRLLNFDAIYDGYVAANPTPERFLDTLIRLEREVFAIDHPPPKGDRRAIVRVGDAINLKDHFEDYQRDRHQTIQTLMLTIHDRVQEQIDQTNRAAYSYSSDRSGR